MTLSSSVTEDDIFGYSLFEFTAVALDANEAGLLGVLEVVAVSLGNLSVDCLLDPGDGVDQFVAPLLHEFDCEGVLGIDGPDDHHSILLQFMHRDPLYPLITERLVLDGDSPRGLGGR